MKYLRNSFTIILLLSMLLLTGCSAPKDPLESGNVGTTAANICMGYGTSAYRDGFIYFSTMTSLCEYDIETGKTTTLIENGLLLPISLHATDNYVYFESFAENKIQRITRDGKKRDVFFERDASCGNCYLDGMDAYIIKDHLYHRNLHTGEETMLLETANNYDVDDHYIYAVYRGADTNHLVRAPKDTLQFEEIPLSFMPISVLVSGEDLFICASYDEHEYAQTGLRYQIIRYTNGKETPLPIYGCFFQVLDNCVIYMDETTGENKNPDVVCYDLATGQKTTLLESVVFFNILDQRYITFRCDAKEESWWLYDWQTGNLSRML